MKLKYKELEIELAYSFRINVYYEQMTEHALDFKNMTAQNLVQLFYCTFITSLQKVNRPICTFLEFLDIIDENGGEMALVDFSNWYVTTMQAQYELMNSLRGDEPEEEKKEQQVASKV